MGTKQSDGRIPVIVGVTGHRNPRKEDLDILKASVRKQLEELQKKVPHSEIVVLSSLAEGGDQICAEAACEMGLEIMTVLPMPLNEYEEDFEGEPLEKLNELISKSSEVFITAHYEPYEEGRDYLYRQAGLYVAEHSHVLLSLWDGLKGDPDGCGSATITQIKLDDLNRTAGEQLRYSSGAVIHIMTIREGEESEDRTPGKAEMLGDAALFAEILKKTDLYNADCLKHSADEPKDAAESAEDDELNALYKTSDRLSVINAGRHRKVLACMSVFATVLTMAFLMYDEAESHRMILLCGLMIAALFAVKAFTGRTGYQRKYLEYRILAEASRVQTYLRHAGSTCEVKDIMPLSLQASMPWIGTAVSAVMIGTHRSEKQNVENMWILDQKAYHKKGIGRTEVKLKRNDRIVRTALILSIAVYLGTLVFEIVCAGLLGGRSIFAPEFNESIRTAVKIALGTTAAATLFAGNYYGKLALPNVIDDHRKMIILYEEAEREIADKGECEPLIIRIAENELVENANWYAYQSKSEPDLGI